MAKIPYNPREIEEKWQERWVRDGTNSFTPDQLRTLNRLLALVREQV